MARVMGALPLMMAGLLASRAGAAGTVPRTDQEVVEAAEREGTVVVYATTDAAVAAPLLSDFAAIYPEIEVEYHDLNSADLFARFLSEVSAGAGSGDLLWSSAMDLQMKLANDGYASEYRSPEADQLPHWAIWNGEAYGTTFEPIVFAYNRRLLKPEEVPRSHAELVKLLRARKDRFEGKLATYDPGRSGLGYLLITQDARIDPAFDEAAHAYGSVGIKLYATTGEVLERIRSGDQLLGVNMISSYAQRYSEAIGVVAPKDYTLVMSRIALVPKAARHPNAARVFLDYLLSARGQELIADPMALGAIRLDVSGPATAAALSMSLGAPLKPIAIGPTLLVYLDRAKRLEFLRKWGDALSAKQAPEGVEAPRPRR